MNSSGKRKTVFLDRDGVINVDRGYVFKVEDFEFFPDTLLALKTLQDRGYQIIIITNQSGIARGFYTVRQYKNLTSYYLKQFKRYGIKNVKVLFCPHHPNAKIKKYKKECNCRKPGIALFEKAIKKYKVDVNNSFAVGDKERDLEICKKYKGIKGFLLGKKSSEVFTITSLTEMLKHAN